MMKRSLLVAMSVAAVCVAAPAHAQTCATVSGNSTS
jgi:hypothetical protein